MTDEELNEIEKFATQSWYQGRAWYEEDDWTELLGKRNNDVLRLLGEVRRLQKKLGKHPGDCGCGHYCPMHYGEEIPNN